MGIVSFAPLFCLPALTRASLFRHNMSSGVQCGQECLDEFEKMKIRSEYAFIIFKITDDKKSIVIDKKGEKGASFDDFCGQLEDGTCRYAVLDVEINTKSGATAN